jgi:hypothetical protein
VVLIIIALRVKVALSMARRRFRSRLHAEEATLKAEKPQQTV